MLSIEDNRSICYLLKIADVSICYLLKNSRCLHMLYTEDNRSICYLLNIADVSVCYLLKITFSCLNLIYWSGWFCYLLKTVITATEIFKLKEPTSYTSLSLYVEDTRWLIKQKEENLVNVSDILVAYMSQAFPGKHSIKQTFYSDTNKNTFWFIIITITQFYAGRLTLHMPCGGVPSILDPLWAHNNSELVCAVQ